MRSIVGWIEELVDVEHIIDNLDLAVPPTMSEPYPISSNKNTHHKIKSPMLIT